ncbi:Na+-transporting NADH:ubiquinone oxidoreductase subunit A [Spirosomataceae bacterium TFI 002]|nr:Na+-transporting NADH:ubiquinone oxidoreductase subunit A [Spirosomataceae bacterium TFI 002]
MGKSLSLKKGFTINLVGEANKEIQKAESSKVYALKPDDFYGVNPKLKVKVGDEVKVGDAIFFDKNMVEVNFPSPVSGEIVEIERGAKRKILAVKILADKDLKYADSNIPKSLNSDSVKEALLASNCWPFIRQRPYNTIANPSVAPKGIFVSTFDSAPLAPDYDFILGDRKAEFDKGCEVLNILSGGNLHLGKSADSNLSFSSGEVHTFSGKHPVGNVGVQIHHISPIQKGEVVWHVNPQDVCIIGELFMTGKYNPTRILALTGAEMAKPQYLEVRQGQSIEKNLSSQISDTGVRVIQGNVLTGTKSSKTDFVSFYTNQYTAIPEGDHSEFLGWLLPSTEKVSLSRSFFSWLMPKKEFNLDTNTHGELRPFVVSGEYEKVLPMNIMPVQLLKSILAGDLEKMEALGIYEVAEEDFALCEFVCSSKIDVQKILREGLDLMKSEG